MFVIYNIRTTGDFVRPGIWLGQGLGLGLGLDNIFEYFWPCQSNGGCVFGGIGLSACWGIPWLGSGGAGIKPLLLQVLLCLAPCVVSPCAGATLGQIDPLYIIASCYILLTSGSGQTKPFFLGKSYGLLKVINVD